MNAAELCFSPHPIWLVSLNNERFPDSPTLVCQCGFSPVVLKRVHIFCKWTELFSNLIFMCVRSYSSLFVSFHVAACTVRSQSESMQVISVEMSRLTLSLVLCVLR